MSWPSLLISTDTRSGTFEFEGDDKIILDMGSIQMTLTTSPTH